MANNYLITGYWGEPHVTPENDRGFNAAVFGPGRFVLPVGEQFRAEYIGNNTVRVYDGKLMDNGAHAGIPVGTYVDLLIPEAGQGMNRSDLIVFQYAKDPSTLVETGRFVVLTGEESAGTAYDPALTEQDLLTDTATLDQMPLWRVTVTGAVINNPAQMFKVQGPKGSELEVLWENAAPNSEFSNQTVKLGKTLADYSEIVVEFSLYLKFVNATVAPTQTLKFYHRLPVRVGKQGSYNATAIWKYVFSGTGSADVYMHRYFTLYHDVNGVYFGSESGIASSSQTIEHRYFNPVTIYGVKGQVKE